MAMHWLIVADAARCRIIEADDTLDELDEIEDLFHPESRLPGRELKSDGSGRLGTGTASPQQVHDHEATVFAKQIATRLQAGRTSGAYERLILVAPPAFLGKLRQALDGPTQKKVVASLPKDLSKVRLHDLGGSLKKILPDTAGL